MGSLTVSCPMLVGAMGPGLGYVPLPLTQMAIEAQCHISMGFMKITLEAYFPQVRKVTGRAGGTGCGSGHWQAGAVYPLGSG